jgi:hypothetical protein
MFTTIKTYFIRSIQWTLVLTYLTFEALIWEGVAKPIYRRIHALRLLQLLEKRILRLPAHLILVLFVLLLVMVEGVGLYAGILFVSGKVLLGLLLYLTKIPVAALTFWLFRISEAKLMRFAWFAWTYEKIVTAIGWLKQWDIYIEMTQKLKALKQRLKEKLSLIKREYFKEESPFMQRLKRRYRLLKIYWRKRKR